MKTFIYFFSTFVCFLVLLSENYDLEISIYFAVLSVCLSLYNVCTLHNRRFTLSSALICYTIFTQFGLIIPYYFIGNSVVSEYRDWTLSFLSSPVLPKAVVLGAFAILIYELTRTVICSKFIQEEDDFDFDYQEGVVLRNAGTLILFVVFLYFVVNVILGRMPLFSTYQVFMSTAAISTPLYHYILILFYLATLLIVSSGDIRNAKLGSFIWLLIVIVFALNGNKGEFMYALLASFGVYGILGNKISYRLILLGALIVFVVIPSITSLRSIGLVDNLDSVQFNPLSAFVEMGMQIRTTVYTIEDLNSQLYPYLWGESYWRPIINILTPFTEHITATGHLRTMYEGYGYNQVVESYMNFKEIGVVLYFFFVSYFLTTKEYITKDRFMIAYYGSITSILINASRNYFAFVPGQIVVVSVLFLFIKKQMKYSNNENNYNYK